MNPLQDGCEDGEDSIDDLTVTGVMCCPDLPDVNVTMEEVDEIFERFHSVSTRVSLAVLAHGTVNVQSKHTEAIRARTSSRSSQQDVCPATAGSSHAGSAGAGRVSLSRRTTDAGTLLGSRSHGNSLPESLTRYNVLLAKPLNKVSAAFFRTDSVQAPPIRAISRLGCADNTDCSQRIVGVSV